MWTQGEVPRKLREVEGLALITTLMVVVLLTVLIAAGIGSAITALRSSNADYRNARAFYAAEAGAEAAIGEIRAALDDGHLSDAEIAAIGPPDLDGFDFKEFRVQLDRDLVQEQITDGPWSGLYSLTATLLIHSQAEDASGATSAVELGVKAQAIPIFQFAVFFEGAGEDYAGSRKDITGRVHSNGSLFLGGRDLHYHDYLTTANQIHRDSRIAPHSNPGNINIYIDNEQGVEAKLTFDSDDTPSPEDFKHKSELAFDSRLQTDAFGVDSLKLPLPDGVPPRELIRPREATDTEIEKAAKLAWESDMYVSVDLTQVVDAPTICGGAGAGQQIPRITIQRDYGGVAPSGAEMCGIFEWKWDAFYDYAEERWVDVIDVDVADLTTWMLADSANNATELIYLNIIPRAGAPAPGTDARGDGHFPILRIRRGAQLPGPLTIGSEYPLFIIGDYNSGNWYPAAVFGDRYAALSNNWDDPNPPSKNGNMPPARDTEQYFALITGTGEGYAGCYYAAPEPGCTPLPDPSYGVAHWMKLLENWNSCPGRCTYRFVGSFVSLWAPEIASQYSSFPGADYYRRPVRDYQFDARFRDPKNLPPGTPVVGQVFRASFREAI